MPISISDYRTRIERDTRRYDACHHAWQATQNAGATHTASAISRQAELEIRCQLVQPIGPACFAPAASATARCCAATCKPPAAAILHRDDRETRRTAIDRLRADSEGKFVTNCPAAFPGHPGAATTTCSVIATAATPPAATNTILAAHRRTQPLRTSIRYAARISRQPRPGIHRSGPPGTQPFQQPGRQRPLRQPRAAARSVAAG